MYNPEKLQHCEHKTQDEDKKNPAQYVLDIIIRNQTYMM
jgi:hypothetical protein